ncbi:TolB family protein [Fibrella arboris]|uniref:TolB family protein n=1 Tax=Fibrella arboris TaxID=3242486 RepID=UPI0035215857
MKTTGFTLLLWLSVTASFAQNGAEVYLLDLSEKAGKVTLSNPRNVSNNPGYDNQPFFHPTRPLLYYTAMMPGGQTDIWSYDLRKAVKTPVTRTPDSEYSPTVLPNQTQLSCIVQRKANGNQDLVSYDLADPEKTELLLESQKMGKIGYQAWLNADEAVVFVLGTPNTMHYLNRKTGRDTVIAGQIGRSFHRIPGKQAFSFVQPVGETWLIRSYDPVRNQVSDVATSGVNSEHYNAWLPSGTLLESRGTELWSFSPKTKQWQAVALPADLPRKKLSRIAVQGKLVAVVIDE